MIHPTSMTPTMKTAAAATTDSPLAIGLRDLHEYAPMSILFKHFNNEIPIYIKTVVWKGIISNLKLDIMYDIVKALEGEVIFRRDRTSSRIILCDINLNSESSQCIAEIHIHKSKSISIHFFSTETEATKTHITKVLIPRLNKIIEPYTTQPEEANLVNISFCMYSGLEGASIMSRRINCPSWDEVQNNYPYTQKQIDDLFKLENPDRHGKFIFWHGIAGSGKSFLIRAALQKWKNNVRCMYIVDPENFFNNANYMQEILLHRPSDADDDDDMYSVYDDEDYNESPEGSKFRLLIIEDGLNNLLTDTRSVREGAVSRFLNLTDGILGQGLRLVFLVTSNEKVNKIDEAFLRKGRCLQELEFPKLQKTEAKQWLEKMDAKAKLPDIKGDSYSLADLYSFISDTTIDLSKKSEEIKPGFL